MKIANVKQVAVVADIHANKYALKKFLNYIESELEVDYILNLGDFIQIGPHPKEVTEIIFSDDRFINILGNNEIVIAKKMNIETREGELQHRKWTEKQLGSDLLEKVQNIPTSRNLEINNMNFFMVHSRQIYNNFKNSWDFPLLYQGKSLDDFVNDYPDKAQIILFGHMHEQLYLNRKNKIFVNPGSLGCSILPSTISFCIIETKTREWNFLFKNLKYDESKLKSDYVRLKVPDRKFILNNFYGIDV